MFLRLYASIMMNNNAVILTYSCSLNVDSGLAATAITQININDKCVTQNITPLMMET